jgi:hypothetical protein
MRGLVMVEFIVQQQPVLPFSRSIIIRYTREEAPVGLIPTFQYSPPSKSAANDNGLAWPSIPFPEGWYAA